MKNRIKRIISLLAVALVIVSAFALPVFAADGDTSDVTALMESGLNSMKSDVMSILMIALPIALGIFAVFFGVRKGIAMLRGVTGGGGGPG